jgi:hypothetical protein
MASKVVNSNEVKRSLAAAFRTENGKKVLIQPESLEETSERDTWAFWLVEYGDQKFIEQTAGGLFMDREPVAANWWETPTLARFIKEATW